MTRARRGTPEYDEEVRRRKSRERKVVDGRWLTGADANWWEFELECGHMGKLLLGSGNDQWIPTKMRRCYQCEVEQRDGLGRKSTAGR